MHGIFPLLAVIVMDLVIGAGGSRWLGLMRLRQGPGPRRGLRNCLWRAAGTARERPYNLEDATEFIAFYAVNTPATGRFDS